MNILNQILPLKVKYKKLVTIAVTISIAAPLTIWGIYGIGEYGIALFIITPLLIGLCSTVLYGYGYNVSFREVMNIGLLSLLVFTLCLICFAIEGLICIGMAAPFGFLFTLVGVLIGYIIIQNHPNHTLHSLAFLIIIIPLFALIENNYQPKTKPVKTEIIINASIEKVWKNVIEFPNLPPPEDLIFKLGIAYPISSWIDGTGPGSVRYCNFNTGSFIEPICIWEEPYLLKFDVLSQPKPLEELSIWDINAPHLHEYFVSKKGQFKLTKLNHSQTKLEGTTWYYHNIKPDFYWRIWSNFIIHKIHNRVLYHIKNLSENENK